MLRATRATPQTPPAASWRAARPWTEIFAGAGGAAGSRAWRAWSAAAASAPRRQSLAVRCIASDDIVALSIDGRQRSEMFENLQSSDLAQRVGRLRKRMKSIDSAFSETWKQTSTVVAREGATYDDASLASVGARSIERKRRTSKRQQATNQLATDMRPPRSATTTPTRPTHARRRAVTTR